MGVPAPYAMKKRRARPFVLIALFVVGSSMFLGGATIAVVTSHRYEVQSAAMEDTLQGGQWVFADRKSSVRRGDIVIVRATEWGLRGPYLTRVIGIGGDRVACCDIARRVTVNGKPLDERYIRSEPGGGSVFAVAVPEGRLWVMGDNRGFAADSRRHRDGPGGGTLAADEVRGRVFAVNGKRIGRSSVPTPMLALIVGVLGPLILAVTAVTGFIRLLLGRRRPRPRPPPQAGFVP